MGCINTKKRLSQVQQQSSDLKEEQFPEFGLKRQDSLGMYDAHNPKGMISQHIQKRNARKTLTNIKSFNIIDEDGAYPSPSKSKGTTQAGNRSSMVISQIGTPNIQSANTKENTPEYSASQ